MDFDLIIISNFIEKLTIRYLNIEFGGGGHKENILGGL